MGLIYDLVRECISLNPKVEVVDRNGETPARTLTDQTGTSTELGPRAFRRHNAEWQTTNWRANRAGSQSPKDSSQGSP